MNSARQFVRFAMAGVIGYVADVSVLYGALALGSGPYAGRVVSFIAAVLVTWRINRRFTFARSASAWREWWRYLGAMSGGALLNLGAYTLALWLLPPATWLPAMAVAFGALAGLMLNFLSAKFLVFRS